MCALNVESFVLAYDNLLAVSRLPDHQLIAASAGQIIEELLRETVRDVLPRLTDRARGRLTDVEKEIGGGSAALSTFGLNQLAGLYRQAGLWEELETIQGRSTAVLKKCDLATIADIRNRGSHRRDPVEPHECEFMVGVLRSLLVFAMPQMKLPPAPPMGGLRPIGTATKLLKGTDEIFAAMVRLLSNERLDRARACRLQGDNLISRVGGGAYEALVARRLADKDFRMYRIASLGNEEYTWQALFSAAANGRHLGKSLRVGVFTHPTSGQGSVMLPQLGLAYSSRNEAECVAILFFTVEGEDDHSAVLVEDGAVASALKQAHANWFRSCTELTEQVARDEHIRCFGKPSGGSDIEAIAQKHRSTSPVDDDVFDRAVGQWKAWFGFQL
jgi:hypothetical protein